MKLFISYAHKDESLREKFDTHLSLLKRQGVIEAWHDREIKPGTEWAQEIDSNLDKADLILLLVSSDFLASDYCYEREMKRAIELHDKKVARVIPIVLRSCDWESAPFGKLQGLPIVTGGGIKPVNKWEDEDEVWTQIVKNIRKVAAEMKQWVEEIRARCCQKILSQYSTIQLLNQTEITVDQLYVDVWLLNRSPRTFLVSEDKMLEKFDLRNDRLGLGDRIKRNEGMAVAHENTRLLILGKPGAGKTTFLKHLAVDCSKGKFQPDLIPVLIELRQIQSEEWNLLDAISEQLALDPQQTQKLLVQGKLLVLMDGLDEVPTSSFRRNVQDQVCDLAQEPKHEGNRFTLTCRTQIIETIPQGFASVEVADFNSEQVKTFVENWVCASGLTESEIAQQWQEFSDAIEANPALKELTVTPVLLSLMCWVFQDSGELPTQTALLYEKGIRLLLEKWNDRKEISRWEGGNEVYRKLELEQKERLLTEIAAWKFENPENFVLFEQKDLAIQIAQILKLSNVQEGEAVLRAIEAQHGLLVERADELWSFSHLTFQEHFTVRWLTQLSSEQLAQRIAHSRWQEVLKQLVKSQPADRLLKLMKQAIDNTLVQDDKIQEFLNWVREKTELIDTSHKPVAIRAFYFDLVCDPNLYRTLYRPRSHTLARLLDLDLDLDFDLNLDLDLARVLDLNLDCDLYRVLARVPNSELALKLQQLKSQLPEGFSTQNCQASMSWWHSNGQAWAEALRQVTIKHRNIGHNWQFTEAQKQALRRYYDANKFLVELLKHEGAGSVSVRQGIEDNLLLPIATLQERFPEMYGRDEIRE
ncbi:TIR domain-containing protein [Leptolyngbya sp. UWPOB_LEPTO1]|uniref:TIR domain-containing protein n=1 Tax=Leptolyngbya sp. UWPOB_LEPTO1 TaxID=2815653 RepID=UPI00257C7B58|nr:TIR domain-containing protein [Leptolyngbya sp. UWPOB_LEPTO1]